MKSFKQLQESLDKPYKITKKEGGAGSFETVHHFQTDGGEWGRVIITPYFDPHTDEEDENGIDLEFDIDFTQKMTGKGDAFRIFATVKKVMNDTMRARPGIKTIAFLGAKDSKNKGDSRIRLYTRLAKMTARQYKMKLATKAAGSMVLFKLTK